MKTNHFGKMSKEEREVAQKLAKETRLAKIEWAKENLRNDYKDEPYWRELASKHKVRLPQSHLPATETKHIKRLFRSTGMDIAEWLNDVTGCTTIKHLTDRNPDAPAYAVVGWALEWIEEQSVASV